MSAEGGRLSAETAESCGRPTTPSAWCLCGVVVDLGDGTCGSCGRRIMTDDDELSSTSAPTTPTATDDGATDA